MITYSIIQKSQLECAQRLDAEYYQAEYLNVQKRLLSIDHFILGKYAFITDGEHGSVDFTNKGVKYLVAENVQKGFLKLEDIRYVSTEVDRKNKRASLKALDVVLSIKGTIGLSAVIFEDYLPANMNRDVSRIHVKDAIDPYFLAVFLNSKLGRNQTLRESSGNVQQMITLGRIRELVIPKISKSIAIKIRELYIKSYRKLKQSKLFYTQAENLLLQKLGLNNFKPKDELSFVVNLSKTRSAHRADSEYFQPKYDELISKLKLHNTKPLLDLVNNVPARFSPKNYPGKRFKYIELSNIDASVGTIDGHSDVYGDSAPSRAKRVLKPGDVIVSSVEGSLEKVALTGKNQDNNLASTGFFQFRSKRILPEVLLVIAKSIILQLQLEKHSAGTILTAVPKDSLNQIVLPVLPNSTQQKLAAMVRRSHEARKKSNELFEKAVKEVDNYIEKLQS